MENQLRAKAKELLENGRAQVVIGYEAGSMPFKSTPLFIATADESKHLVWNPTCVNNLSVYISQAASKGKTAVVVKPCDVKSVVELIKEHQLDRENVVTIVPACQGVIAPDALKGIDLRSIKSIDWKNDGLTVTTATGEVVVPRKKAFASKCLSCTIGDPVMADVKIGEPLKRQPSSETAAKIAEYEKLSPSERRAFWAKNFERCIRCYACRSVCPTCYCKECFVDKQGQIWASKSTDAVSNWFFHVTRAIHTAGRCIGCGECERVCPMDIPLSLLNGKLQLEVEEMFGSSAGEDSSTPPILGTYAAKDPDPCPE
jgi:coenzyme F420-reducing hydrogenase beta subunit